MGSVDPYVRDPHHGRRVVILDDDPTGTQTVHGIPVITTWDAPDLHWAFAQDGPGFFIETNSRSLSTDDTITLHRELVTAVTAAARRHGTDYVLCSRSDSTLRGHFDAETRTLTHELSLIQGWKIGAVLLIPAYIDAGRVTIDGTHYAHQQGKRVEIGSTEYARDATFGFTSSSLADWVQEVTDSRIVSASVSALHLADLRREPDAVADFIRSVDEGTVIAVDAETDHDLQIVADGVRAAEADGARFIYRCGPSFIRARLRQTAGEPITESALTSLLSTALRTGRTDHGLIIAGSHVPTTTAQLTELDAAGITSFIELNTEEVLSADTRDAAVQRTVEQVCSHLADRPVTLHTSRSVVTGTNAEESLSIARTVSDALITVVENVLAERSPAYILAKGGITSSDVAARALHLSRAITQGTMLPGIVSLWTAEHGTHAGLPYVVFAGNVGEPRALTNVVERLERARNAALHLGEDV